MGLRMTLVLACAGLCSAWVGAQWPTTAEPPLARNSSLPPGEIIRVEFLLPVAEEAHELAPMPRLHIPKNRL
ncbi:MAG: hypothetical protein ACRC8S_22970 [Fimbriiglobus sp.]